MIRRSFTHPPTHSSGCTSAAADHMSASCCCYLPTGSPFCHVRLPPRPVPPSVHTLFSNIYRYCRPATPRKHISECCTTPVVVMMLLPGAFTRAAAVASSSLYQHLFFIVVSSAACFHSLLKKHLRVNSCSECYPIHKSTMMPAKS